MLNKLEALPKPKCQKVLKALSKAAAGHPANQVIDGCLNLVAACLLQLYGGQCGQDGFRKIVEATCDDLRMMVAWQEEPDGERH
jgi:hypothetical protein